jgi:hypothetical protein
MNDENNSQEPANENKIKKEKIVEGEVIGDNEEISWSERLLSADHWLRFVFMILFAIILSVAGYIMGALVLLQFFWALITGEANEKLKRFGSSLSQFIFQALRFLTYNTEEKPFPFADWPEPSF